MKAKTTQNGIADCARCGEVCGKWKQYVLLTPSVRYPVHLCMKCSAHVEVHCVEPILIGHGNPPRLLAGGSVREIGRNLQSGAVQPIPEPAPQTADDGLV